MSVFFNNDFIEYIQFLNKYKVEYVLVGGMAVNIHGYRRSTGDMDIYVNTTVENHLKLRKVHADFGMHMGEMENLENFLNTKIYDVFTFGVSPVQIDIMTVCKGIEFQEAHTNAINFEIDGKTKVLVADYRAIITTKKASARMRDLSDIQELDKIRRNSADE